MNDNNLSSLIYFPQSSLSIALYAVEKFCEPKIKISAHHNGKQIAGLHKNHADIFIKIAGK